MGMQGWKFSQPDVLKSVTSVTATHFQQVIIRQLARQSKQPANLT